MLDNNYERDGHGDPSRERPNRSSEPGPISDREVPLAPVARIMAALPTTYDAQVMASWWKKPMQLTPMAAIAVAAGIFALGVVIANVMSLR